MEPYERFLAWQACHDLHLALATEVDGWPRGERFELSSQVRRAAWSAPANIAEGSAKRGNREFRRYLDISLGSLAELSYALRFAKDRKILSESRYQELEAKRTLASKLTWGLYAKVRDSSADPGNSRP